MSKIPLYTPAKILRRYGGTTSSSILKECEIQKRERDMRMEQNRKDNLKKFYKNFK